MTNSRVCDNMSDQLLTSLHSLGLDLHHITCAIFFQCANLKRRSIICVAKITTDISAIYVQIPDRQSSQLVPLQYSRTCPERLTCPIGQKNVVSQHWWFLVTGSSVTWKCGSFCQCETTSIIMLMGWVVVD